MRFPGAEDLDEEQRRLVRLPFTESALVRGGPGTGKTIIALHRATAVYDAGYDVQLITHGRALARNIHAAARLLGVEEVTSTFHSWFWRWHENAFGTKPPQIREWVVDWSAVWKELDDRPELRGSIDHLVIDEGQDFVERFHSLAAYLAKAVTVFADENQRITDENSTIEEIRRAIGVDTVEMVRRNHRNTRPIAQLAAAFDVGLGPSPELPDRVGDRPRLTHHVRLRDSIDRMLAWEADHPAESIGVFLPTIALQTKVAKELHRKARNPVQLFNSDHRDDLDFRQPGFIVLTYWSTKGLEFDTVFIPELNDMDVDEGGDETRMRLHVLTSRARDHLFLMYSGTDRPPVLDLLPKALLTTA